VVNRARQEWIPAARGPFLTTLASGSLPRTLRTEVQIPAGRAIARGAIVTA
jgi:hypothetical protein